MQLLSNFNKGIGFLLFVVDIYSKYAWILSLKDKKGITIDDFGVSDEISSGGRGVQVRLWTQITQWKCIKIKKISSTVCGFFCILTLYVNVFIIPRPSGSSYI